MRYYRSEIGLLHAGCDSSMAQPFDDIRKRIDAKLTTYAINGSGDVKRLRSHGGGCRLRVSDWRVIFIEDAKSVTVFAVGNRREIYD